MHCSLLLEEIRPFVRYAAEIQLRKVDSSARRVVAKDCRLFLCKHGAGSVILENGCLSLTPNMLALIPAGTPYLLTADNETGTVLVSVNFDYTGVNRAQNHPLHNELLEHTDFSQVTTVHFSDCPWLNAPMIIPAQGAVYEILEQMRQEYYDQMLFFREQLSGLMIQLISLLVRRLTAETVTKNNRTQVVDTVIAYIREHYRDNITNQDIGKILGYHPNYLNCLMRNYTDHSLHEYLRAYRIRRSLELIQLTDMPITQISREVGFRENCHFSRCFKKYMGVTPTTYRVQ